MPAPLYSAKSSLLIAFPPFFKEIQARVSYGIPTRGSSDYAEFESFYIGTCIPPTQSPISLASPCEHKQWDPAFLEFVKQLEKQKPVIFTGDLNVAHTRMT